MSTFKKGDRVRLRAMPEKRGTVAHLVAGENYVNWDNDDATSCYRLPAELELIPEPTSPIAQLKETRDAFRRTGDANVSGYEMSGIIDLVIDAIARVSP